MSLTMTVDHIQRGQAGNYAPHVYESEIRFEGNHRWDVPTEDGVKKIAQVLVHPFTEEPSDGSMDAYFQPRLTRFDLTENTTEGNHGRTIRVYRVRIERPYTG